MVLAAVLAEWALLAIRGAVGTRVLKDQHTIPSIFGFFSWEPRARERPCTARPLQASRPLVANLTLLYTLGVYSRVAAIFGF